ncbi:MAG: alpha/beta fold hydrolase [Vulcanimicrobiaceae bacterium]
MSTVEGNGKIALGESASEVSAGGEPFFGFRGEDLMATAGALAKEAAANPTLLLEQQAELVREITRVLAGQSDLKPLPGDKRFADVAWADNPFYRVFMGGYLAWTKSLEELVEKTTFDGVTKERARFVTQLITSALAPSNSLANPVALKRALDTGGASIVHGLQNMMSDLFTNSGMPTQVDKGAFEVGKNLGTTEGSVIFRNEVLELIQYKPQTETVFNVPLLFIPPQINKFYIFDLSPQNSIFDFLLKGGMQVFTISWRNPTAEQRDWGIDTYVSAIIEAVGVVKDVCGVEKINIGGACAGAMTLAALLGYYAASGVESPFNCATHLVAVLDFGTDSMLGMFMTKDILKTAKASSERKGVLDGSELGRIFAWLRPNDLVWNYWVNNYLLGKDPPAFDLLYWNADTTRLPAKFHAELMDAYAEGKFVTPGAMVVLGKPIDLKSVSLDSYFVCGITDHITPWKSVYANMMSYSGNRTLILSAAGHIQSLINPPASASKRQYLLNPNYVQDPDEWLKDATSTKGSWWGNWLEWLQRRSGERVDSPAEVGNAKYTPIVKSPGTYVVAD